MTQPRRAETSELAAYGALFTAALVWGGSVVAQKMALGSFSAVELSVLRGVGALIVLVPLWAWREGARVAFRAADLGILGLLGLTVLGNHLLMLFGLRLIPAGAASVIIGANPVITAVLSSLLIGDVPFRVVWFGCLLAFAGVALVSGGGEGTMSAQAWLGGLLVFLAQGSWALYSIGGRWVMDRFSALTINWTTLLCSILIQSPLLALDRKALQTGVATVPGSDWLALIYLIVFATALGQQAWLYGVQTIGPSRAGVFVNVIPVSALLLSALILAEPIGVRELLGIALILWGVWWVNRQSSRLLEENQRPARSTPDKRTVSS